MQFSIDVGLAAGAVDGPARIALMFVIVLLVAIVVAVSALAVIMKKRTARPVEAPAPAPAPVRSAPPSAPPVRVRRAPTSPMAAGGGLAVATSGMVCPTCRTEYAGLTYCTRDARRLVPAEEMLGGGKSAGGVCVSCRRAYEPGLRRCPHDGGELVPAGVAAALRGKDKREDPPTGVLAKNCPACRQRFDLAARFCGHDGTELVVVN
jgi:hypothetical protein